MKVLFPERRHIYKVFYQMMLGPGKPWYSMTQEKFNYMHGCTKLQAGHLRTKVVFPP